jgi:hypothetical protein
MKILVRFLFILAALVIGWGSFFAGSSQVKTGFQIFGNPIIYKEVPMVSSSVDLERITKNLPVGQVKNESWLDSGKSQISTVFIIQADTSYTYTISELMNSSPETLSLFDKPREMEFPHRQKAESDLSSDLIYLAPVFLIQSPEGDLYPLRLVDLEPTALAQTWADEIKGETLKSKWKPKFAVIIPSQ